MTNPWGATPRHGMDPVARQMAQAAQQAADQARVAAQSAQGSVGGRLTACRLGSAKTPLLVALGGSTDLTVMWSSPMPSADYRVEAVAGPGLIGQAALTVKSKTTTGCVITVTAQGLAIAAGAVVFAHATY